MMNREGAKDVHRPELEAGTSPEEGDASAGGQDETRGIDLAGLLGGLLGKGEEGSNERAPEPGEPPGDLSGLLGGLAGGGDALDLSALAGQEGLSLSSLQAVVPLLMGALLEQGELAGGGPSREALDDLAQGKAGALDALAGAGLLEEVMGRTGLNQSGALAVIVAVLKALGLGKTAGSTHSKPKPKPKPRPAAHTASAKPKPKPKPSASAASKPKPKPKPAHASSSAKPKPKPKPKPRPAAHTTSAKPKPRPKPRPKRSGEIGEGSGNASGDPAA